MLGIAQHADHHVNPMRPYAALQPQEGRFEFARAEGRMKRAGFAHSLERIRHFERMLVAEYYQRVFGVDLPESVVGKG